MADNAIVPKAIMHNADNERAIHGNLMVVYLSYPFTFVYYLSTLRVIARVIVHNMV